MMIAFESVPFTMAAVLTAGAGLLLAWWFLLAEKRNLPPFASASLEEILKYSKIQEGFTQLNWTRSLCLDVSKSSNPQSIGNTTYGSVVRAHIPFQHFFYCSDYKLGRLVLIGDSSQDIHEGEKAALMKLFNFFDHNTNSLVSHLTSNKSRYRARKTIATSFSMVNLQKRIPDMEKCLKETLIHFDKCAESGELLNIPDVIFRLLIQSLSSSAFGVTLAMGRKPDASMDLLIHYQYTACL